VVRFDTVESRWGRAAVRVWRHEAPPPAHLWPLLLTADPDAVSLPKGVAKTPTVAARVNHGRWQTECPFCLSAQHASSGDRLFYCANCMNAAAGHKTLRVTWPRDPAAIEAILAARPHARYRNWDPGETIRDLKRQDAEWGGGA
jgi:ribosomal protein L37AE/L43A